MKENVKTILSIILLIVIIVSIKSIFKKDNKETGQATGIPYRIVDREYIPTGNAKRFVWSVAVDGKINAEELEILSKEIIEEAKKEESFNAIAINFYDYEEYIGNVPTLGQVDYAPEGDWAKANTVKAGDYKKMDYKFSLMEKDWDEQLTKEEVEIYGAWKELYDEKMEEVDLPDEDEINEEIAQEFDIKVEDVSDIMRKQSTWTFSDKNK